MISSCLLNSKDIFLLNTIFGKILPFNLSYFSEN